jgi:hypothetical protein
MAITTKTAQGAPVYPAIPMPDATRPTTMLAAVMACKQCIEIMLGLTGNGALALASSTSTSSGGGSTTTGLTQAQVLARVSLGV